MVLADSKLLSPVLGTVVSTPKPEVADTSLGKIPELLAKAACMLMVVVEDRRSGKPESIILPWGGWTAEEVSFLSCARANGFPSEIDLLGFFLLLAPDVG